MSDDKKITKSSPLIPIKGVQEITETKGKKVSKTKEPSTISQLPASDSKPTSKGEIALPKPKGEPDPEAVVACLKKFAKSQGRTITLSPENAQALLNLFADAGTKALTPKQLDLLKELLGTRTPEQNKASIDEALLKYAIGPDGKFTEKFIECLKNPELHMPSGSSEEIKEKFSFFALLLLLNQLSSFQRDMATKSMQMEQISIGIQFDQKKEGIKNKAIVEAAWSIVSSAASLVLGLGSAYFTGMGKTSDVKAYASGLRTLSEGVASIGQSSGKAHGATYEITLTTVEEKQSLHNFKQQEYKRDMDASTQQQEGHLRTADEFVRSETASKQAIIRNI